MSDVTAVVLSIGEAYTDRALASVARQSMAPAQTIVVRDVVPFHRALNSAAARVGTEFFVQVDADMILDEDCIATLRACMAEGVGIVAGHLRDPLRGRIECVKLFRARCFDGAQFRDSIWPDRDFGAEIERQGWTTIYALKSAGGSLVRHPTFGEHRPAYTPHYTFCKFAIEGARGRQRRSTARLRTLLAGLLASPHEAAPIAAIAVAHGFFADGDHDRLQPYGPSADFNVLERFLSLPQPGAEEGPPWSAVGTDDARQAFKRAYARAVDLRRRQARSTYLADLQQLRAPQSVAAWAALVGLCHGLFTDAYVDAAADAAFALVEPYLVT